MILFAAMSFHDIMFKRDMVPGQLQQWFAQTMNASIMPVQNHNRIS